MVGSAVVGEDTELLVSVFDIDCTLTGSLGDVAIGALKMFFKSSSVEMVVALIVAADYLIDVGLRIFES